MSRISTYLKVFLLLLCSASLWEVAPVAQAQTSDFNSIFLQQEDSAAEPEIAITLIPEAPQPGEEVTLKVSVVLPEGHFTYALDNPTGAKPRFKLTESTGFEPIDDQFQTKQKPQPVYDAILEKTALKFYEQVTWTQRFKLTTAEANLTGTASIPVCNERNCQLYDQPISFVISATNSGETASSDVDDFAEDGSFGSTVDEPVAFGEEVEDSGSFGEVVSGGDTGPPLVINENYPLSWSEPIVAGSQKAATISAKLIPGEEGQAPRIEFTAAMEEGWHTYSMDKQENAQSTSFSFRSLLGLMEGAEPWKSDQQAVDFEAVIGSEKKQQKIHHGVVTWTKELEPLPESDAAGNLENMFTGVELAVRIQFCTESHCLNPKTHTIRLGTVPAEQDFVVSNPIEPTSDELSAWFGGIHILEEESIKSTSFSMYMLYAFLGGLFLNVMPCVLPVLAIKILSFVKQAGESRAHVIALNVAYSAGVIFVFLVLACLISLASLSWGGLFQSTLFNLVMTSIIFAMALSLLGLYEIPIPGLVGSAGSQQREGVTGAFLTGIFATLLATPCSGPFLGTTLAWSATQPIAVTFSIFFMLGLGMASPYLILGVFPEAIKLLPKPGNWMVRLKELSGFILLGTVIFFLSYIDENFQIPLLVILLAIGFSLWLIGSLPATHISKSKYWVSRSIATATTVIVCVLAYRSATMLTESRLPWQPFSTAALKEASDSGKTVLIDFTADWCVNCKVVEQTALNTPKTYDFVQEHDIVTFVADWTDGDQEITRWLNKFESKSIPLTVIFPANRPMNPLLIRDLYLQKTLLEKLEQAVSIPASQTAASSDSDAK
ncbi:MAG: thioredoxin family protein [Planctomycetaceae bacterium]